MKFYKLSEVPIQNDDRVFKASPIGAGISFAVILESPSPPCCVEITG